MHISEFPFFTSKFLCSRCRFILPKQKQMKKEGKEKVTVWFITNNIELSVLYTIWWNVHKNVYVCYQVSFFHINLLYTVHETNLMQKDWQENAREDDYVVQISEIHRKPADSWVLYTCRSVCTHIWFLAHLSWKLEWAFFITCRPSSVCLSVRPSVCKLFTFSSSSPEPRGQFQPNLAQCILGWRGFKCVQMKGPVPFQGR